MAGATDKMRPKGATEAALSELARKEGEHPVEIREGSPEVPLVFDSPHSGRYYPVDFRPVVSLHMLREYEDRFVDLLIEQAARSGATLVMAHFPRAYVDPNRAADDIDETMLEAVWPEPVSPTRHSRLGTGLIFRTMRDESPIYDRQLTVEEVRRRIEACWRPYHFALESALEGDVDSVRVRGRYSPPA
jgi:N-formylglutamate deformylase